MDHEYYPVLAVPRRTRSASSISKHAGPAADELKSRSIEPRGAVIPPAAVPAEALNGRIAIVGTAGSGRTYATKGFAGAERHTQPGDKGQVSANICREHPAEFVFLIWSC